MKKRSQSKQPLSQAEEDYLSSMENKMLDGIIKLHWKKHNSSKFPPAQVDL